MNDPLLMAMLRARPASTPTRGNGLTALLAGLSPTPAVPAPNPLAALLAGLPARAPTPAPAPARTPHWIAVTERFKRFHSNLLLTPRQEVDAQTKAKGIVRCLNAHYYDLASDTANAGLIGSWAKETQTRPPRDVDLYFYLPAEVHARFQLHRGNRQSDLLQEVKGVLAGTYPSTDMRGDGQVVVVRFDSYNVEVVPAFELKSGNFLICDTNDGGRYMETNSGAELRHVETVDAGNAGNLRPLIRMLKAWQANCNVPIKSFHLELVAAKFLEQSPWRLKDWFYYDWLVRDFFAFLLRQHVTFIPGTTELAYLGNEWRSRAESGLRSRAPRLRQRARQLRLPGRRGVAEDLRDRRTHGGVLMDERARALIDEGKRQELSCLYASTECYEWVKSLRVWRAVFVLVPVILGVLVPFLKKDSVRVDWQPYVQAAAAICAILAGISTAVYKALALDVNLDVVTKHAQQFKVLQDRFRQAWRVTALGPFEDFKKEFDDVMSRMDGVRGTAPTPPERFFKVAQKKIKAGHYSFPVDKPDKPKAA